MRISSVTHGLEAAVVAVVEAEEETIEARMVAGAGAGVVGADTSVEGAVAALMEEAKVKVVVAVATRPVEEEEHQEHSTELLPIDIIPRMNTQPSLFHRRQTSKVIEKPRRLHYLGNFTHFRTISISIRTYHTVPDTP
jgi:hypothetical protein